MKLKFGLLAALSAVALAVGAFTPGAFTPGATAYAQEAPPAAPDDLDLEHDPDFPRWLRHSIIVCAAGVMNLEVEQVVLGLREGHSLKEIGLRAGVRPFVLEHGILYCEAHHLARLVQAGELDPPEARRIFHWLATHITRIINFHWNPGDETFLQPPAVNVD